MPDVAQHLNTDGPTRTCVGCGRRERQGLLLRLQFDGDARLQIVSRPGHGRSAYIHADATCRTRLRKSRLLAKSLRRAITEDHRQQAAVAHESYLAQLQTDPTNGHETAGA
jgi:predicted RNA-binding protein YlxR (DUF448 family)